MTTINNLYRLWCDTRVSTNYVASIKTRAFMYYVYGLVSQATPFAARGRLWLARLVYGYLTYKQGPNTN